MDREVIQKANAAAELILANPSTAKRWGNIPGELIPAAYAVARAWLAGRNEQHRLADEFADKGTLKHFLLSHGFMPHDEKDAQAIILRIIEENERKS